MTKQNYTTVLKMNTKYGHSRSHLTTAYLIQNRNQRQEVVITALRPRIWVTGE